jgi:hypothetical protein
MNDRYGVKIELGDVVILPSKETGQVLDIEPELYKVLVILDNERQDELKLPPSVLQVWGPPRPDWIVDDEDENP